MAQTHSKSYGLVDVRRIRLNVPFGVIVGHILLKLAMQLLVSVVYEKVCHVLLLDKVADTLLFIVD